MDVYVQQGEREDEYVYAKEGNSFWFGHPRGKKTSVVCFNYSALREGHQAGWGTVLLLSIRGTIDRKQRWDGSSGEEKGWAYCLTR